MDCTFYACHGMTILILGENFRLVGETYSIPASSWMNSSGEIFESDGTNSNLPSNVADTYKKMTNWRLKRIPWKHFQGILLLYICFNGERGTTGRQKVVRRSNVPVGTASYHIYSGTECEARSTMRVLVTTPAKPGSYQWNLCTQPYGFAWHLLRKLVPSRYGEVSKKIFKKNNALFSFFFILYM